MASAFFICDLNFIAYIFVLVNVFTLISFFTIFIDHNFNFITDMEIKSDYDEQKHEYKITIKQLLNDGKTPYHMPYKIGLVNESGEELP